LQETTIKEEQIESSSKKNDEDNTGQQKEIKNKSHAKYIADGDLKTRADLSRDETFKAVRSMI